jgi:hypothetical protein
MHEIERVIDILKRHDMRNQVINIDFAIHVPIDDLGDVGSPSGAPESGALPHAARHQLKRPRLNGFTGPGNSDDDGNAPTTVATFERLAHEIDIADTFEAVIGAAVRQGYQVRDQILANFLGIDEMRHSELLGQSLATRIQIDADD